MAEKYVITISRQFASMGRSIAKKLAEELGIEFYDRDIVEQTARRHAAGAGRRGGVGAAGAGHGRK